MLDGPQQTHVGLNGWLTLEPDGHALMVYRDSTAGTLKAARCGDAACSTAVLTTVSTTAALDSSVVTGVDGLPMVFAVDNVGGKAIHCSNGYCLPYVQNR